MDKTSPTRPVLIVDDEPSLREFLTIMFKKRGIEVESSEDGESAMERLRRGERFRLVLTDLKMPGATGLDVLRCVKGIDPACQVIIMTAYATADTAISAIRDGAYDYLTKPFKIDQARAVISRALEKYALISENLYLKEALKTQTRFGDIVGSSAAMKAVFDMVMRVAATETTVLITGESGTGKELIAQAIHAHSERSEGPFLPINCGAIPENLIEAELFGYRKGAFTGALHDRKGLFEAADGGTVFLDEVGELPAATQVKLLRVLQERKVKPVGGTREVDAQARVVAATNRDLEALVAAGEFREDLYYRLNIIPVELPPLRDRGGDVQELVEYFMGFYADRMNKPIVGIEAEALRILINYSFPGNVRELQNIMERAVTLEQTELISTETLPYRLQEAPLRQVAQDMEIPDEGVDMEAMVEDLERALILKALDRTGGVKTDAAKLLGITFRAMRYRCQKYRIGDDD